MRPRQFVLLLQVVEEESHFMDPITLTSVGTVVISEGVKFLYGQATDLLKRWQDRKADDQKAGAPAVEPVEVVLPAGAFEGQLQKPAIHYDALEMSKGQISEYRKALADYVDGIESIDPNNQQFLTSVDKLRALLEAVYQQRITFKGERRETSGPVIEGSIDVEKVVGDAAAVRVGWLKAGKVTGEGKAKEVAAGGRFTVVEVGTSGDT
jgi:hypothetical protein